MKSSSRAPVLGLLPGGLLLLATALPLSFLSLPHSSYLRVQFGFYIVLCAGVLLAWRFRSTRVLFSLLVLLLVEEASFGPSYLSTDHVRVLIAAFLLPISLLVFSFLPERGFTLDAMVPRAALVLIDFVALGVGGELHVSHGFSLPWLATALCAAAALVFLLRAFFQRKNLESGFFWGLVAAWLALRHGGVGVAATAYLGTSALILGASLIETFYFMAYHDELTGLPSRRAFNEAVLALAGPYSIAVVDIDHFKSFNDLYGHDTGDEVLRMVAARLAQVGGGGQAFRCGGEEFAVLFRNRPAVEALPYLEELRGDIQESVFCLRGPERRRQARGADRRDSHPRASRPRKAKAESPAAGAEITSVTVSIGVADPLDVKQGAVQQVIAAADKALYRAKAGGRNRVETPGGRARPSAKMAAVSQR
ncbi:MAG TPA: GGDEF domain-containing protein [Terriglobales bacterium]|nr:GGDEF domain-containing protein [Terriglobales bacterium]